MQQNLRNSLQVGPSKPISDFFFIDMSYMEALIIFEILIGSVMATRCLAQSIYSLLGAEEGLAYPFK